MAAPATPTSQPPQRVPGSTAVTTPSAAPELGLTNRLTFASSPVQRFTAEDFELNTDNKITLRDKKCILILFYTNNQESQDLARVWVSAAASTAGPIFGAVDMLDETKVAQAFAEVKSSGSHGLHWASLRTYPFILVYRNGYPVASYNGARNTQALVDYALTLACEANYYEPIQLGGGEEIDPNSQVSIPGYAVYRNIGGQRVERTTSSEYTGTTSLRGYTTGTQGTPTSVVTTPTTPVPSPTPGTPTSAPVVTTPTTPVPVTPAGIPVPVSPQTP